MDNAERLEFVNNPFTVYSLDTSGNRIGEVPSRFEGGILFFRVSTRGPDGKGRIYYEILNQDTKGAWL